MGSQYKFFESAGQTLLSEILEGFNYEQELISARDEQLLIERVSKLPFKKFEFHGHLGNRRTVSFGWQYEFSGRGKLHKADDIPEFLLPLRTRVAAFAGLESQALQHVLVIEYGPGAGIGWHRDKPVFGEVIGVSLLSPCLLRFRRTIADNRGSEVSAGRDSDRIPFERLKPGTSWERVNLLAEPRSAYHLSGPARSEWEHSILRVDSLRYSITFRSMVES